jgi:hypothetical protein
MFRLHIMYELLLVSELAKKSSFLLDDTKFIKQFQ